MGKKYLNTKEGSIEQSVLDVWQEAAEMHAKGMDGRTTEYRSHRGKLESNRVKRENKKNSVKTEQPETQHGSGEHAFEIGTDRYREHTQKLTPGQIEEVEIAEMEKENMTENLNLRDTIKNLWIEAASAAVDPKDREELDKEPDGRGGVESAKNMKRAKEPAPNVSEEAELEEASGDKEAYKKFFNAALKKFKVSSPAELKGDDKKKFFDYIDKGWEGDNEKAEAAMSQVREFKIQSMKAALAQVWGMEEGHNPFKTKNDKKDDEEKKENTLTGKKKATIDINPHQSYR